MRAFELSDRGINLVLATIDLQTLPKKLGRGHLRQGRGTFGCREDRKSDWT
ncbi:hypothetical protein [Rhizobium leguminosarum]|uniref:hypothetical protein n=1 Tax=Rhizobium leguminosarum TaxID=384 RepID=UPI001A8CCEC7|nr:hypothetical protein [Rhizobium leguminosarum]